MGEDQDKPSDNRRRISPNIIEEVESFDGKDFSEQLLKWKNSSDSLSVADVEDVLVNVLNHTELDDVTKELRVE